jgi:hypothetical protein
MMSKVTLYSFVLALLLGVGIWAWAAGHVDGCTAFLRGDEGAPAKVEVQSGSRTIVVPCSDWFLRQRIEVQALCLIDAAIGVIFLMNGLGDWKDWFERRRGMRGV